MFRNQLTLPLLAAVVSVPGFVVGQQLRNGDGNTMILVPLVLAVVLVASLLMRQSD